VTVADPVQLIHPAIVVTVALSTALFVTPINAATYPAGHVIELILVYPVAAVVAHFTITDYPTIAVVPSFYFKVVLVHAEQVAMALL